MRFTQSIRLVAVALGVAGIVGCDDSGPQAVKTSASASAAAAPVAPTPETFKTPSGKTMKGLQPSPPPGG